MAYDKNVLDVPVPEIAAQSTVLTVDNSCCTHIDIVNICCPLTLMVPTYQLS